MRSMLLVLEAEAPQNQDPTNAHIIVKPAASFALGEIHGWRKCLQMLKSLGTFQQKIPDTHIEPTYTDTTPANEGNPNG